MLSFVRRSCFSNVEVFFQLPRLFSSLDVSYVLNFCRKNEQIQFVFVFCVHLSWSRCFATFLPICCLVSHTFVNNSTRRKIKKIWYQPSISDVLFGLFFKVHILIGSLFYLILSLRRRLVIDSTTVVFCISQLLVRSCKKRVTLLRWVKQLHSKSLQQQKKNKYKQIWLIPCILKSPIIPFRHDWLSPNNNMMRIWIQGIMPLHFLVRLLADHLLKQIQFYLMRMQQTWPVSQRPSGSRGPFLHSDDSLHVPPRSSQPTIVSGSEWQHSLSPPHKPFLDDSDCWGHWLLITHKPPSCLQASVVALVSSPTFDCFGATTASFSREGKAPTLKMTNAETNTRAKRSVMFNIIGDVWQAMFSLNLFEYRLVEPLNLRVLFLYLAQNRN